MASLDIASLEKRIDNIFQEHTQRWRRHIHAHPDLSNVEIPTADYIEKELRAIDTEGILKIRRLLPNAVVVDLVGRGGEGPIIALRSDHDALPILEKSGETFSSTKPGIMHACGHDSHTAMNMSAVVLLLSEVNRIRGTVRFVFQPAEEACGAHEGGARPLIAAGVLDGVKMIFGLHMCPDKGYPTGTVGIRCGTMLHSADTVMITLRGPGGHSSQPYNTVDLVAAAAAILSTLPTMVTRRFAAPLTPLLTICSVHTNTTACNVIPTEVVIKGTLRTTDPHVQEQAKKCIPELAEHIFYALYPEAKAKRDAGLDEDISCGQVEALMLEGTPCTVNHPDAYNITAKHLPLFLGGQDKVHVMQYPLPPSEDFAEYALKIPANFSLIGSRNEGKGCIHALHSDLFKLDEEAMKVGVKVHYAHIYTLLMV